MDKISRTYIPAPRADMVVPRLDRLVAFTAAQSTSALDELFTYHIAPHGKVEELA